MGSWLGVMPFGKSMQVLVQHRFAITRDVSKYGADLLISQVMPGAVKSGVTDQNDTRLRTFLPQPPPSGGGFLPCPTGNPLPRTWRGLRPSRAGRCNTNPNMGSTKGPPRNQRASHFVPGKPTTPPGRALGCRAGSASSPDWRRCPARPAGSRGKAHGRPLIRRSLCQFCMGFLDANYHK